ncbi:CocE/NonD family hydrolase, partial [Frankia sp. AgKG'84/4]|uniref:CocE/NonD family hydrolase n=1 Tax=Frankia sp. AgKG'84/4 TaxID=573490 RepID=UPI00202A13A9
MAGAPTDRLTGKRAAGTFPVIVQQNPYVFGGDPDSFFVSRGYIFVSVDVLIPAGVTAAGDRWSPRRPAPARG